MSSGVSVEDYTIQCPHPCQCCVTQRVLEPGEAFYAAVFSENGNFVRKDYSLQAWKTCPPEDCVGYWRTTVPQKTESRRCRAMIHELLLSLWDHLRERGEQPDKLYILSLFLVRRRMLRLEEPAFTENPREVMELYSPTRDESYTLPVVVPTPERQAEIQQELTQILMGNSPLAEPSPHDDRMEPIDPDCIELPEVVEFPQDFWNSGKKENADTENP
ncbi:MAG: hypothetical protein Q4D62_15720 [Planctomycetia bacterium]|nr:hypothetical protein [Planctomycetia bacterium]